MRKARKDAMDGGVIAVPDSRGWGPTRRDTRIQHSSFRKFFSMKTQTSAINRDAASIHGAARHDRRHATAHPGLERGEASPDPEVRCGAGPYRPRASA